jgi:opacity protein-like surface antigen
MITRLLRTAVLTAAAAVLAVPAVADFEDPLFGDDTFAHEEGELYLYLFGGTTFPDDTAIGSVDGVDISGSNEIELDDAFYGGVAAGRYFSVFRAELEYAYRGNDFEDFTLDGDPTATIDGDLEVHSLMINGFYDWQVTEPFQLYAGAGLGIAYVSASGTLDTGLGDLTFDDETLVFAYQVMVGAAVQVQSNVVVVGGYRGFSYNDPDIEGSDLDAPWYNGFEIGVRLAF